MPKSETLTRTKQTKDVYFRLQDHSLTRISVSGDRYGKWKVHFRNTLISPLSYFKMKAALDTALGRSAPTDRDSGGLIGYSNDEWQGIIHEDPDAKLPQTEAGSRDEIEKVSCLGCRKVIKVKYDLTDARGMTTQLRYWFEHKINCAEMQSIYVDEAGGEMPGHDSSLAAPKVSNVPTARSGAPRMKLRSSQRKKAQQKDRTEPSATASADAKHKVRHHTRSQKLESVDSSEDEHDGISKPHSLPSPAPHPR